MTNNYNKISLYLANEKIFKDDYIYFEHRNSIIFGKNETGKSTICKLIKQQIKDNDVRIFDGFENIIDDNKRLNAVVLGEENVQIKKDIDKKNEELSNIKAEKDKLLKSLQEPEDKSIRNLWVRKEEAKKAYESSVKNTESIQTSIASEIKNMSDPQIAPPTYDKRALKIEIDKASKLSIDEINKFRNTIKSNEKNVKQIEWPQTDYLKLLDSVNKVLIHKVEAHVYINRLEGNKDKKEFAKEGLRLHKPNEICAFCGNVINQSEYDNLVKYFLNDDVKEFQNRIESIEKHIDNEITSVKNLEIHPDDFYEIYKLQARDLSDKLKEYQKKYLSFLNNLKNAIHNKKANLFDETEPIKLDIPDNFIYLKQEFEMLRKNNNSIDLLSQRENAKKKLRYSAISEKLIQHHYKEAVQNEMAKKNIYCEEDNIFNNEMKKITGKGGFNEQINEFECQISSLQDQTKNENILAEHINKKLHHLVSFEIIHCAEQKEHGYYLVKDTRTNEARDITQLSTGEKNIIAFLYFIEKLDEVKNATSSQNKLIVFDDPMNSNDDSMQYLIIEELHHLMNAKNNDRFIVLTHNKHFYLNICYRHDMKK